MGMSLSDLRRSPHVGRPRRSHPICVARRLTAAYEALLEEASDLEDELAQIPRDIEGEGPSNARLADAPDPRIAEIEERLEQIDAEKDRLADNMAEHTGEVVVEAMLPGEWKQWVNAHPARDGDDPNFRRDVAFGAWCNADALIDDLGLWVVSWNGEPLREGDWEFVVENAPRGALKQLAALVINMHEGDDVPVPKSRISSSATTSGGDG